MSIAGFHWQTQSAIWRKDLFVKEIPTKIFDPDENYEVCKIESK